MSQKVSITLVSDLTGTEIAEGKGETVTFALDGSTFELDLTTSEAKELRKAFDKYVSVARKVGRAKGSRSTTSKHSKEELANVRAWAKANGHDVSERGRIASSVMDAYTASRGA